VNDREMVEFGSSLTLTGQRTRGALAIASASGSLTHWHEPARVSDMPPSIKS